MSDEVIIRIVRERQRICGHGILPADVVQWLPFGMSIGYARKVMRRLWTEGQLIRVGGKGARRGYLAPAEVSRLRVVRLNSAGLLRVA
jgi:hypothetical protein